MPKTYRIRFAYNIRKYDYMCVEANSLEEATAIAVSTGGELGEFCRVNSIANDFDEEYGDIADAHEGMYLIEEWADESGDSIVADEHDEVVPGYIYRNDVMAIARKLSEIPIEATGWHITHWPAIAKLVREAKELFSATEEDWRLYEEARQEKAASKPPVNATGEFDKRMDADCNKLMHGE